MEIITEDVEGKDLLHVKTESIDVYMTYEEADHLATMLRHVVERSCPNEDD